jgi:hypothetical protein
MEQHLIRGHDRIMKIQYSKLIEYIDILSIFIFVISILITLINLFAKFLSPLFYNLIVATFILSVTGFAVSDLYSVISQKNMKSATTESTSIFKLVFALIIFYLCSLGYGLFLFFVAFLLFVREKNRIWQWAIGIMALVAVMGTFASGTRGSMLGLAAGIASAIVGYIIVLKEQIYFIYNEEIDSYFIINRYRGFFNNIKFIIINIYIIFTSSNR